MNYPQKTIILFDGVCNLCNRSVQFILKHDKRNRFLFGSLQGVAGQAYLKKFDIPPGTLNSFMLVEGEKLYTRSSAALRTCKALGNGWQLLYVFIIIPKFIRDALYDIIARNRYKWFGKREACWLPTPELAEKFLE